LINLSTNQAGVVSSENLSFIDKKIRTPFFEIPRETMKLEYFFIDFINFRNGKAIFFVDKIYKE